MSRPSRSNLRRPRKEEAILQDIVRQVREGALAPGDRLASIKDLCATYKVSQRIVDSAIGDLVSAGIVVTRHRRGCFITNEALARVADFGDAAAPVSANAPRQSLADFMVPRSGKRTLALYTPEIYPQSLKVWRTLLDEFAEAAELDSAELLGCQDGHLEDLMASRHVDVVVATPLILNSIGRESFVDITAYDAFGLDADDLLPIVRERLEQPVPTLGLPFQLTVSYLFVNLDLAAKVGLTDYQPTSVVDLIDTAVRVQPALAARGAQALTIPSIYDLLVMDGALRILDDGQIHLDEARALAVLTRLAGSQLMAHSGGLQVVDHFAEGRLLYMRHCSFEVSDLMERASCRWTCQAVPHTDSVAPIWLNVLAINKQTAHPEDSMALVRFLASLPVQRRLAKQRGNLSALSTVAHDPALLQDHPVSVEVQDAVLAQSTLKWPEALWVRLSQRANLGIDTPALLCGDLSPADALARLKLYLEFTH